MRSACDLATAGAVMTSPSTIFLRNRATLPMSLSRMRNSFPRARHSLRIPSISASLHLFRSSGDRSL